MGENVTTRGIDLLGLPRGARLRIGPEAIVEITGLRNPCSQLDDYQRGLTAAVLGRNPDGSLIRKAGVMGVVLAGGRVAGATASWSSCPRRRTGRWNGCSGASAIRPCRWGEDAARQNVALGHRRGGAVLLKWRAWHVGMPQPYTEPAMARFNFTQDPEEPDLWAAELVPAGAGRPPIHVMIQTDGEEPGSGASKAVKSIIDKLDDHVLAASEFLLDHYSYEQCKKHGYEDDQLLAEETAEAMAGKAVLRALWLFDEDGEGYELWFTLPWDPVHTYDVEFEDGEPVACSVND